MDLIGKTVLVTGASSGTGCEVVIAPWPVAPSDAYETSPGVWRVHV